MSISTPVATQAPRFGAVQITSTTQEPNETALEVKVTGEDLSKYDAILDHDDHVRFRVLGQGQFKDQFLMHKPVRIADRIVHKSAVWDAVWKKDFKQAFDLLTRLGNESFQEGTTAEGIQKYSVVTTLLNKLTQKLLVEVMRKQSPESAFQLLILELDR